MLLANWLDVFAHHYRGALWTEGDANVYALGLADLTAKELDRACHQALQECRFLPTVAEIRASLQRAPARRCPEALVCKICQGTGWVAAEAKNEVKPCACRQVAQQVSLSLEV